MIELIGKYTKAIIYAETIEEGNNGEISKMIDKNLIEEYQNNGWKLGRLPFKKKS